MKNKLFFGILVIILAFGFISCTNKVFGKFPSRKTVYMGNSQNPKMNELFGSKAKFATLYNEQTDFIDL